MTEKHLNKCSTSLVVKEMQIKTILKFYLTPVTMAKIKKIQLTADAGEDMEKEEHCSTVGGLEIGTITLAGSQKIGHSTT